MASTSLHTPQPAFNSLKTHAPIRNPNTTHLSLCNQNTGSHTHTPHPTLTHPKAHTHLTLHYTLYTTHRFKNNNNNNDNNNKPVNRKTYTIVLFFSPNRGPETQQLIGDWPYTKLDVHARLWVYHSVDMNRAVSLFGSLKGY